MATLQFNLSTKIDQIGYAEVLVRFNFGAHGIARAGTDIFVPASRWRVQGREQSLIEPRTASREQARVRQLNRQLAQLKECIITAYNEEQATKQIGTPWLKGVVAKFHNPNIEIAPQSGMDNLTTAYAYYLKDHKASEVYTKNSRTVLHTIERMEDYLNTKYKVIDVTPQWLSKFEYYISHEHEYYPTQKQRGQNTINFMLRRFRTFVMWAIDKDMLTKNPFRKYELPVERYGDPICLTIEERNKIRDADLTASPQLAIQRDIFVFQCLTGCRVSDLQRLTKASVINGAIEYIAHKTAEERPQTIRVPLIEDAQNIVSRYSGIEGTALLPFIEPQAYNRDLKKILHKAGVERMVTTLNHTTGEPQQQCIADIASSHLARRTFISTAINKSKDSRLVASLSGHSPNSKAISRYYIVEEQTKRDIVELIK